MDIAPLTAEETTPSSLNQFQGIKLDIIPVTSSQAHVATFSNCSPIHPKSEPILLKIPSPSFSLNQFQGIKLDIIPVTLFHAHLATPPIFFPIHPSMEPIPLTADPANPVTAPTSSSPNKAPKSSKAGFI